MAHISQNEFEKLNWLPINDRINQCVLSTTFKFVNDIGPNYLNEVFQWAAESNRTLRNDYRKLKHPSRQTTAGQNLLSFLGPSKWSKLPGSTKKCNNINTFKHNLKKTLSGTTYNFSFSFFFLYFWNLFYLRDHNENKAFCLFCVTPAKKTQFLFIIFS